MVTNRYTYEYETFILLSKAELFQIKKKHHRIDPTEESLIQIRKTKRNIDKNLDGADSEINVVDFLSKS